jgi:large repetitive protein
MRKRPAIWRRTGPTSRDRRLVRTALGRRRHPFPGTPLDGRKSTDAAAERPVGADTGRAAACQGTLVFGGFLPVSEISDGSSGWPAFVALGDLDGDRKPDLVTANLDKGKVGVLLGKGDGTFANATSFATGSPPVNDMTGYAGPFSVALGDVNGDGKLDIVTANAYPGTVSVLLGKGDGTFADYVDYGCGKSPYRVVLGDVNRDGKPDIVTANNRSDTVSVLLGKGDGTLDARPGFQLGHQARLAALGDFNNDGRLDVMTSSAPLTSGDDGLASLLLGKGDGTFTTSFDYPFDVHFMAPSDVNADGRLDLVGVLDSGTLDLLLGACR